MPLVAIDRPPRDDRADSMRSRILLAAGGLTLGLATLLLPHPEPFDPVLLVAAVLLSGAIAMGLWIEALAGMWERWGDILAVATVTLVVAATGGPDSVYQDLYLLPLLAAAALRTFRQVLGIVALIVVALLAPFVYSEVAAVGPYITDAVVDAGTWVLAAAVVGRQAGHHRQQELEARANEERFRQLAEHAQDGIYRLELEPEVRFVYVNPAMEDVTGFAPQAFYEDPSLPLLRVHPDDRELVRRSRTDPRQQPDTIEVRWRHAEGHWVWHALREAPVFEGGKLAAIQGIVRDVTPQKIREEELALDLARQQEAAEDLRQLDVARTTTLRAVAHDLRSPLMSITGFSGILRDRADELTPRESAHLADRISGAAERLERILNALLELEQLTSVGTAVSRDRVELDRLVRVVVSELEAPDHEVTVDVAPVEVAGDAAKLERAIDNLVRNAVHHTPSGSHVRVSVVRDGGGVQLVVEDDGPGVKDTAKDTIFEPFERGASTVAGTGVGLSLVRAIAELHGGRAWVEDRDGGGARFAMFLPDHPTS